MPSEGGTATNSSRQLSGPTTAVGFPELLPTPAERACEKLANPCLTRLLGVPFQLPSQARNGSISLRQCQDRQSSGLASVFAEEGKRRREGRPVCTSTKSLLTSSSGRGTDICKRERERERERKLSLASEDSEEKNVAPSRRESV